MEHTTEWRIKLNEVVLGPLKKIQEFAGGAQRKIASLATATSDFAKQHSASAKIAQNSYIGLQDRLRQLEGLQQRAWDTKHIQNYQKAINKVKADISAWEAKKTLPSTPQSWFSKVKGQVGEGLSQINLPGGNNLMGMLRNPALIGGAVALMAYQASKSTAELAINWEYGMKKINATAQLPTSTLDKLDKRLTTIGENSGGNFSRIPESYEKILSVTGKVNQSLDILQVAVDGAKAGFTDLDIVGQALANTMAVVGTQNTTASHVMDTLLKAKAVGAGEFTDFAQYIPLLTAAGKVMGVTFEKTAGLFAYMTFKGQTAANAAVLIQNVFSALQKKDITKGLKENGILVFNKDGSRRQIDEIINDLTKKVGKLSDEGKNNFFNKIGLVDVQARTGLSELISDAKAFKNIMTDVSNAVGETNRQLAATSNFKTTWAEFGDETKRFGKDLGVYIIPVLDTLLQGVRSIGRELKSIFSGEIFKKSYWMDFEPYLQNKRQENIRNIAVDRTREYYKLSPDQKFNREQWAFYSSIYKQNMEANARLRNKNNIVKGESDAGIVTDKKVTEDSINTPKEGEDLGGSRGPKTLIMNLDIKNFFQKGDEKVKNKHTDDIVDAARDALVVVGGNQ